MRRSKLSIFSVSEPIIQMIIVHVAFIILAAVGKFGSEYYAKVHYFEPADQSIANREARKDLANIIVGMFKDLEIHYQQLLSADNLKHIQFHSKQLQDQCSEVVKALSILENGGRYKHIQLVNFYEKDAILEIIEYKREKNAGISVYGIDIAPKIEDFREKIAQTEALLIDRLNGVEVREVDLRLLELQISSLQQRLKESANKVFYDIRQSNAITREKTEAIRRSVESIVAWIDLLSTVFVVAVAVLISIKISQILRKQRKTEEQNRKLSIIVDQSPSSIVITDKDGVIEYVNPAFLRISGYSHSEAKGKPTRILKSGLTSQETYKALWDTISSGNIWSGRLCNKRKDGSLFHEEVMISPVRDDDNQIINYVSVKIDVTERVHLAEKNERAHLSLKAIVDNLPVGVVLVNREKKIIEINNEASRIFGYSDVKAAEKAFLGSFCKEAFCDADFDSCPIIDRGKSAEYFVEKTVSLKDDISILKSALTIDYNGEEVLMEVFLDITERKRHELLLEKEIKKSNRLMIAANEANRVKSDFLANMSHEIRTPLNSVLNMNEMLLRTELSLDQRNFVKQSSSASKMLLGIINDILDFSKIEAGKLELDTHQFTIRGLFDRTNELFLLEVAKKGLQLEFVNLERSDDCFWGDSFRLEQVFCNLVGNAIKFTKTGTIHVSATLLDSIEEGTSRVRFEVSDPGIGISQQQQQRLFQAFSQADTSTTRKYGGTGLGLVISSHLVNAMGGTLAVESEEGEGARFFFELSLRKAEASTRESNVHSDSEKESKPMVGLSGCHLLLVEDNEMNQFVVSCLLEETGAQLSIANNGKEGVELVREGGVDLVLMDLQMPVMDGFVAMRRIREFNKSIPIIALSAAVLDSEKQKAKIAGANAHHTKPIEQELLLSTITSFLNIQGRNKDQVLDQKKLQESSLDLSEIEGLDCDLGLQYASGSLGVYHKTLIQFRDYLKKQWSGVDFSLLAKGGEESFRKLHTLKGLAKTVGASDLAAVASEINDQKENSNTNASYAVLQNQLDFVYANLLKVGPLPSSDLSPQFPSEAELHNSLEVLHRCFALGEFPAESDLNNGLFAIERKLSLEVAERFKSAYDSLDFETLSQILDQVV